MEKSRNEIVKTIKEKVDSLNEIGNDFYTSFEFDTIFSSILQYIIPYYTYEQLNFISKQKPLIMFAYLHTIFVLTINKDFVFKNRTAPRNFLKRFTNIARDCGVVDEKFNELILEYEIKRIDRELYHCTADQHFNKIMKELKLMLSVPKYDKLCHCIHNYSYYSPVYTKSMDSLMTAISYNLSNLKYSDSELNNRYYIRGFGEKTWSKIVDVVKKYDTDFIVKDLYSVTILYQLNVSLDDIENLATDKQFYKCVFVDRSDRTEKVFPFIMEISIESTGIKIYNIYGIKNNGFLLLNTGIMIDAFKEAMNKKK